MINGKIPAHTECEHKRICPFFGAGKCLHKGVEHNVEFSCGAARVFEREKKLECGEP